MLLEWGKVKNWDLYSENSILIHKDLWVNHTSILKLRDFRQSTIELLWLYSLFSMGSTLLELGQWYLKMLIINGINHHTIHAIKIEKISGLYLMAIKSLKFKSMKQSFALIVPINNHRTNRILRSHQHIIRYIKNIISFWWNLHLHMKSKIQTSKHFTKYMIKCMWICKLADNGPSS